MAETYASCIEQPVFRLFLALSASLNYLIYGGDAQDAFAHSPAPTVPTYVSFGLTLFGRSVGRGAAVALPLF